MSEIIPIFEDSGQRSAGALRGGQEARVMMMLGNFAFSIDTAAYHQLTR
ncbi:TPA: phage tail protein, partial [Citrobacter freundii]|nr:phage tail protein [Citrobacter freundii]